MIAPATFWPEGGAPVVPVPSPIPVARPAFWCMPFSQFSESEVCLHLLPAVRGLTAALETGANLLQPGCGHGAVLRGLAWRFPRSRFAGICDFPSEATIALRETRQTGLRNLWFRHTAMEDPGFGAIFDAALLLAFNPAAADEAGFSAIAAQLKPGGALLLHVRLPAAAGLAKLGRLLAAADLVCEQQADLLIAPGDVVCVARR